MIHIICDICKKQIHNATTTYSWETKDSNYRQIFDKALCYSCQAEFDKEIHDTMNSRNSYTLSDKTEVMKEVLERMTR